MVPSAPTVAELTTLPLTFVCQFMVPDPVSTPKTQPPVLPTITSVPMIAGEEMNAWKAPVGWKGAAHLLLMSVRSAYRYPFWSPK